MKIEPLIVVKNVQESSRFYQELLACQSGHGGNEYEMLISNDKLILQLHLKDAHEHAGLWNPAILLGNGVALWFRTDHFIETVARAKKMNVVIVAGPHVNPNAKQHEFWFRDPDGYLIVISDNMGDAKE